MQARTSIYHKLILYIFFLGIFVIVAVSLYSFITSRDAILQRTFDQLTSLRAAKKEQVEQFFTDRMKEVELFSHQENSVALSINTRRMIGAFSINIPQQGMNSDFKRFFKSGNYYETVYLLNDGRMECYRFDTASAIPQRVDMTGKSDLQQVISRVKAQNRIVIEDYSFRAGDSMPHLYIASPIFVSNRGTSGAALFEIRPSAINKIMKNNELLDGLGKSGEIYLVGPDSLIRSESRFYKQSILRLPIITESVRKVYRTGEGTQLNKDYRGLMTLSSFSRLSIPGLNWAIIAEMDKKEAMRPVQKLANEIVFLSIFITLILFVVAYVISRTIAGPIIELKNATIRVMNGDLESVLSINSNDELGELTENFNLMTSQLKNQQKELKDREIRMFSSFIDGQEDERQRLSRELHDGLGQMIIATKLKTESMLNSGNGFNNENIPRLRLMFDLLVDEVRGISNNLMPAVLNEFGLEMALNQICGEISTHSDINVIFDSQVSVKEIDKRVSVYVFRIAQEALNNAVKHASAKEIIMSLIGNEKMISLMVQDDGRGINLSEPCNHDGRGLNSICERVKLLNGLLDISKGEVQGTIVSVKIPLV